MNELGDKKSFVLYTDYEQHWDLLTGDEAKALDKAIFRYVGTGEIPDFDGVLKMAFSFVKANLDRDNIKWLETKEKRVEAAKKGAEARWGNRDNKV